MAIEIDNWTLVLLAILAVLALYHRFSSASPLVHPLLLGRQSDVTPVRQPGESGVYRAWGTGHGTPLQVRPGGQLKTVGDAVRVPPPGLPAGKVAPAPKQRFILDTPLTNEALAEIVRLVPLGLRKLFPSLQGGGSVACLLPPSPITALPLLLLSLSSSAKNPLVVLPHPRLLEVAIKDRAPGVVVIHESAIEATADLLVNSKSGVLIVGDTKRRHQAFADRAGKNGVVVHFWEDVWDAGESASDEPDATTYSDIHSYFYSDSAVVQVTHMNITAGTAAFYAMFPADKRPTSRDVIASAIRLDTPLGMSIAIGAVWGGAGFRLIGPPVAVWDAPSAPVIELGELTTSDQPMPTILILTPAHHAALIKNLHNSFLGHPFGGIAARHRLRSLQEGYVAREGLLDKFVWAPIRNSALGGIAGDDLRAVLVIGETPTPTDLARAHALLSLPISRAHASPLSAGPVFASHFNDLQAPAVDLYAREMDSAAAHTGPPANNVEVMLRGPGTDIADGEHDEPFEGSVWIRGPAVLRPLGSEVLEGWTDTGDIAAVYPNGTFVIRK